MKYTVQKTKTIVTTIEVEASSTEQALDRAKRGEGHHCDTLAAVEYTTKTPVEGLNEQMSKWMDHPEERFPHL